MVTMGWFIVLILAAGWSGQQAEAEVPGKKAQKQVAQASRQVRIIKPADLKTGPGFSTPVISGAQKFIVPVPQFGSGGEPLVYPPKHQQAGQPIKDYQGKPIGDRGIVFFNGKDRTWQAATGDGQSVIILNEVSREKARLLDQKIRSLQPDPGKLTLAQLKAVLSFARSDLKINDMYNSTRTFIREKMTPVSAEGLSQNGTDPVYGLRKRDDRDINQAIYIPGAFRFEGPAATPQVFTNGGVIVEQGGAMRGVQPEIFMRTYTLADGKPIRSLREDIQSQSVGKADR